ncbi:hypothetical protein AAVH_31859, partial [Aphelenchoides avenae]
RSTVDKHASTDKDGDDPEYVESEDDDEEDDEQHTKQTESCKSSSCNSPPSLMSSFSVSQAPRLGKPLQA